MKIIDGKIYKEINIEDLTKEELIKVVEEIKTQKPEKEYIKEYIYKEHNYKPLIFGDTPDYVTYPTITYNTLGKLI